MQFQKSIMSITLATLAVSAQQHAATANPPSASHASTQYEVILQQLGLKTTQSQAISSQTTQFQSQKSISTDRARQTFFSQPLHLVRSAAFTDGGYVPSTYEFTLTIPQDAGQPLKAVTITQATNVETQYFSVKN